MKQLRGEGRRARGPFRGPGLALESSLEDSPPKGELGKLGGSGRRWEERAGGRCWEGRAGLGQRGGGRGRGAGRGRGRRAAHFLLGAGLGRQSSGPSASGLWNLPALTQLAAGNCLRAGAGSPGAPRVGGPGAVTSETSPGIGLQAASCAAFGPLPRRGPGPGPWPGGRGRRFLAFGKLRGRGGCSGATGGPRATAALPLSKVSPCV